MDRPSTCWNIRRYATLKKPNKAETCGGFGPSRSVAPQLYTLAIIRKVDALMVNDPAARQIKVAPFTE